MCEKCNDTGRITFMVWSGAFMFKPCDCNVAKENEQQALEKGRKLRAEILEKLKMVQT